MLHWVLVDKPKPKTMFAAISKSNPDNEIFSKVKSIKGSVIRTVKLYVKRDIELSTAVVTNWDIYHQLSDAFKKKHEVIVYSSKMDWCEDVWQFNDASTFVSWHMPKFDRILVLGGSKFIKQFKSDIGAYIGGSFSFNHVITVIGNTKQIRRKGWSILETGDYYKDIGFFNDCGDNVNVFIDN